MWSHPIKVLDGFWLGVGTDLDNVSWLPPADRFETSPVAARHVYPEVLGVAVQQETWAPHDDEAFVVTYEFKGGLSRRMQLRAARERRFPSSCSFAPTSRACG